MKPHARLAIYILVFGITLTSVMLIIGGLTDRVRESERAAVAATETAQDNADTLDGALSAVEQLGRQVKRLGGTPVVEPADVADLAPLVGPVGVTGATGQTGQTGRRGEAGTAGSPGTDGSPGPNGQPGDTGAAGSDGASGPAGPAGPAGEPGPAGSQGDPGPQGAAGYPDTWTYTDAGGVTYRCSDPDGDHTYACVPA